MLAGTFQQKIKKLNKNLRIFCGNDNSKPAGLYIVFFGEYVPICGVDKNELPDRTIVADTGHIIKGGWRRVVNLLIQKKLVDHNKAQRVFGTELKLANKKIRIADDPTIAQMHEIANRAMYKRGVDKNGQPLFNRQDLIDMGTLSKLARR